MRIADNRRDGVRVTVSDDIEGVIIADNDNDFPCFCNRFIINMGGLCIKDQAVECHHNQRLRVNLFHSDGTQLSIIGKVVSTITTKTIIKFKPLLKIQRLTLQKMLKP